MQSFPKLFFFILQGVILCVIWHLTRLKKLRLQSIRCKSKPSPRATQWRVFSRVWCLKRLRLCALSSHWFIVYSAVFTCRRVTGFALLRYPDWLKKKSFHIPIHSEGKLKPIVTRSHTFPALCVIYMIDLIGSLDFLCPLWLVRVMTLVWLYDTQWKTTLIVSG